MYLYLVSSLCVAACFLNLKRKYVEITVRFSPKMLHKAVFKLRMAVNMYILHLLCVLGLMMDTLVSTLFRSY